MVPPRPRSLLLRYGRAGLAVAAIICLLATTNDQSPAAGTPAMVTVAAAATAPVVSAPATVPATTCVSGASRPKVATLTPQLKVTVADPDTATVTAQFEWWTVAGEGRMGGANVSVAAGATAATTLPAGAFVSGGRYKWRVRATDGSLFSAWTSFCELQVYTGTAPSSNCAAGIDHDYNGDGIRDVAVGDPGYAANGQDGAGRVTVIYGGGVLPATSYQQGSGNIPGGPEAGDRFGHALATYDADRDGCSDLVVSAPFESSETTAGVGSIVILYGSPGGLATTKTEWFNQGSAAFAETLEAGDAFGFALSATNSLSGEPILIVGVPGEDIGTAVDAGMIHYRRGTTSAVYNGSDKPGGAAETGDQFGYSLASSPNHFAVGSPGEAIEAVTWAGVVEIFTHELISGKPKRLGTASQQALETAEQDDAFGKSIAMVAYQSSANTNESMLVIGVPGEDALGAVDAGLVHRLALTSTGFTHLGPVYQATPGIGGGSEVGDHFGEQVVVVNRQPATPVSNDTVIAAVGTPGEDFGAFADNGVIYVFPAAANPVPVASQVHRGAWPGNTTIAGELIGIGLGIDPVYLYLASSHGSGSLMRFSWSSLVQGDVAPNVTWPAPSGQVAYGASIG
ncbi:hypothetical protein ACTI_46900 [Actinoplanes sp. OR16]|uniref:integrin alpha n=1 Tax=Actinoplanes sp. OR16 TaxID=946334 RepID=UPI000F6BE63E|nr:integrin alpha [Actinoplanes sp. OR16]BBH68005.1 hypothetical protein ACTI_46900 [Actinoplanes sp. OR16]